MADWIGVEITTHDGSVCAWIESDKLVPEDLLFAEIAGDFVACEFACGVGTASTLLTHEQFKQLLPGVWEAMTKVVEQ